MDMEEEEQGAAIESNQRNTHTREGEMSMKRRLNKAPGELPEEFENDWWDGKDSTTFT